MSWSLTAATETEPTGLGILSILPILLWLLVHHSLVIFRPHQAAAAACSSARSYLELRGPSLSAITGYTIVAEIKSESHLLICARSFIARLYVLSRTKLRLGTSTLCTSVRSKLLLAAVLFNSAYSRVRRHKRTIDATHTSTPLETRIHTAWLKRLFGAQDLYFTAKLTIHGSALTSRQILYTPPRARD